MDTFFRQISRCIRFNRQKQCLLVHVPNENIAHFFHEQLQYLWIALTTARSKELLVYVDSKQPWIQEITRSIVEGLGFTYLEAKPLWWTTKTIQILEGRPEIFAPTELPKMRSTIYNHRGLKFPKPDLKVLYTRGDAFRRRIVNASAVSDLFDVIIDNLEIPFNEQIELFSRASHFVAPEGAHMTNLVLMNPDAAVMSIQVNRKNSWPEMFGTSTLVRTFDADTTVLNVTKPELQVDKIRNKGDAATSLNGRNLRDNGELDMDIAIDQSLKASIVSFLQS